jgi:5-methylcytosine-specific restriction endonuclease McrA
VQALSANPTAKANASARRRNRVTAAKKGHRDVTLDTIWARDNGRCCICGVHVARELATLEHKIPVSKGGQHVPSNLGAAHRNCNSKKRDKTPKQIAKEATRPGLKRKGFRRKIKPMSEEAIAARDKRLYDQTVESYSGAPCEPSAPPDDCF